MDKDGEIIEEFVNEEEAWKLTYSLLSKLVREQRGEWIQTPTIPVEIDAIGQEQSIARQEALRRRQTEQEHHLDRLRGKLESMDDDDVRKSRLEGSCEQIEAALADRGRQIKNLSALRHRLTAIAVFIVS